MLARLLHPLDRRQQTLLLTLMSFGGSEAKELMAFLPDEDQAALGEKATKLDEIPREKRVPLMIRQLTQMMTFRAMKGVEGVEPSWLSAGFKGESPRVIAIALMHMPSSIARQIVSRLPDAVREAMPSREELASVPLPVVKLVRARFDAKFATMPLERELTQLRFRDLVMLTAKELVTVIRHVGADEIACAFLAVGKRALAEFLNKLPPEDAEELIAAVKRADMKDQMEVKAARGFLAKVLGNFNNTDELFQKAGLYRLARAISVEDPTYIRQVSQRFPRAHGRLLGEYLGRVREEALDDAQVRRLRDQVLDVVANLSRRGKIEARYGQSPVAYEARG
jgi:flagellar motor switch protein FliG